MSSTKDVRANGFTKFDSAKVDLTLVEPELDLAVAAVAEHGAKKYGRDNWKLAFVGNACYGMEVYERALQRHALAMRVEWADPDSGLPHVYHVAWNCMAILYGARVMEEQEIDARADAVLEEPSDDWGELDGDNAGFDAWVGDAALEPQPDGLNDADIPRRAHAPFRVILPDGEAMTCVVNSEGETRNVDSGGIAHLTGEYKWRYV